MALRADIDDWKKYPNALGSESQAAVIVGEVAVALHEAMPDDVRTALRVLSLRGTMRDIASQIQRNRDEAGRPDVDVVDVGAAACGLSWAEAVAAIVGYLGRYHGP